MEKEKLWVRELQPGMSLVSTFVASETKVRNDSRGSPYLLCKLVDRTGSVEARMWGLPHDLMDGLPDPSYVRVEGNAHEYRGMLQVKIERLQVLKSDQVQEEDYLPASEQDRQALAEELLLAGEEFENEHLRKLFELMVGDEELWEAFCTAPAAKTMHHAHIGGLLEHSVQCLRVARGIAELYPVDRDTFFFGMIFHDIGKTKELSWGSGGFSYTTVGRLTGHVVLGDRIVNSFVERINDFPEELALRLSHLMLSHQGELEYGSPEVPKTFEALLVNLIDNLDARTAMFANATENVSAGGWSHHENPLRRALYVPESSDGEYS